MVLIAASLLLRTYADVWMITTSTKIEAYGKLNFILLKIFFIFSAIIARKQGKFLQSTMQYLMCMPLISVVNSFLKVLFNH